jgi:hypothetical protein
MSTPEARLQIRFHGRVIEHLGIDMYQSPVAAIAELVSNAWDADATRVEILLPDSLESGAQLVITDNGEGMTFQQCQDRYLKVGYNRRTDRASETTNGGRPVMGRKGIGKFAGFGIADLLDLRTVSAETGELTVFRLDVERLTGGDEGAGYADTEPMDVEVIKYLPPDEKRREQHGTQITLRNLTMKQRPNTDRFRNSMARRFLLLERAEEFQVLVDDVPIAEETGVEKIEFDFPSDYRTGELPNGVTVEDGWGVEHLPNGHRIRWRFVFYKSPIKDEDLAGVSIFSHHKLAQRPFTFNLSGGIGAQQALHYLSGRVRADYIDDQKRDLISTERQRINWESDDAAPLLEWGQSRVKSLARIWQEHRASAKVDKLNERMSPLGARLGKLEEHERRIVRRALESIAKIPVISDNEFADLANSVLHAWEGGRLRGLINKLANSSDMDADELVRILVESRVMLALHTAEQVKTKLNVIDGLEKRIVGRELENAVRDYIAGNPWLIAPRWDTFRIERSVTNLVAEVGNRTLDDEAWNARVDLVLSAGSELLVIEFMRPGVTADWDHINRFERYVLTLRDAVSARTELGFRTVTGLLVADRLERASGMLAKLESLTQQNMRAVDWPGLLAGAKKQWQEYFEILYARAPGDDRMHALASDA